MSKGPAGPEITFPFRFCDGRTENAASGAPAGREPAILFRVPDGRTELFIRRFQKRSMNKLADSAYLLLMFLRKQFVNTKKTKGVAWIGIIFRSSVSEPEHETTS